MVKQREDGADEDPAQARREPVVRSCSAYRPGRFAPGRTAGGAEEHVNTSVT